MYINSFRAEEARRLLDTDAEITVSEIAGRLGFGTARTLQRAFKERYDMTPTQYREASKALSSTGNQ
ncbi:MAG: helix-turn-helix domain-containing protein [Muribaculaceae bacterium]|nr:helix-turn-helix domain-containing protein [Muribaculaceae bacterium]